MKLLVAGRGFRSVAILALPLLFLVGGREASARPQHSVSGQLGVVAAGGDGRVWHDTLLNTGLRYESIWFRESPRDFGIGPYLEARTGSFSHGEYGGGVVALLPVDLTFPLWLGAGAFARRDEGTTAPGGNAFLAWGGRSYNHHGTYAMAFGLLLDARVRGGEYRGFDMVLTASIDLQAMAYPVIMLISAFRH